MDVGGRACALRLRARPYTVRLPRQATSARIPGPRAPDDAASTDAWLGRTSAAVESMLAEALATGPPAAGAHLELEARLGRREGGRFVPGAGRERFEWYLARCEASRHWSTVYPWAESEERYARDGSRTTWMARRGAVARVRKVAASTLDCDAAPLGDAPSVRVSLQWEVPEPVGPQRTATATTTAATAETTTHVRLRRRRTFVYRDLFRYDFTVVREGSTPAAAAAAPERHEIEVECVDPAAAAAPYLARSLLLKALDLLRPVRPAAARRPGPPPARCPAPPAASSEAYMPGVQTCAPPHAVPVPCGVGDCLRSLLGIMEREIGAPPQGAP